MQAYNNDPELKKSFLAEIEKHHKADHFIYETRLGIPEWLTRIGDTIFKGLPVAEAKKWPTQFAEAIPVGANLEPVKWQFCSFIMKENIDRVLGLEHITDALKKQVINAIRQTLAVHEGAIKTGGWHEEEARAAAAAAWSAARAAWSAEAAVGGSAAWSAARAAARAAAAAAWSAARSPWSAEAAVGGSTTSAAWSAARAAWSAAKHNAYKKDAKELLKLLEEAK